MISKNLLTINWRLSCKKGVYIFLGWFQFFCRIKLIFGRLTCFDMKSIVPKLFLLICASFSRNNVCKKLSFPRVSFGNLLLNEKQKKPFVLLNNEVTKTWHLLLVVRTDASFIIHVTTLFSYCCFISPSK